MAISPMPSSIEEIRRRLSRDRRGNDRRKGKPDTRVYPRERRGLERRGVGHTGVTDGDLLLDDIEIELTEEELEPLTDEETRIVMRT
jgi:hypothetical protein